MLWFIFSDNSIVLCKDNDGLFHIPQHDTPPLPLTHEAHIQELPELDGNECRAYRTSLMAEELPDSYFAIGLRESYYHLSTPLYLMAGKASELLHWDTENRYCGTCGHPMQRTGTISKQCPHCNREIWPQVYPAIIVRISKRASTAPSADDEILLVKAHNFRRNFYGLVAGFVETGETLEDCVRREIWEETKLQVKNIRYFGSQPWPYPCGIMIGFTADYESGILQLQNEELKTGDWFRRDNLPTIPEPLSISRHLIDAWIEEIPE